jgi:hypothetical protein
MIDRGCGGDAHKETAVSCVIDGGTKQDIRTYGTATKVLIRLEEWMLEKGEAHVAMESAGSYWMSGFHGMYKHDGLLTQAPARAKQKTVVHHVEPIRIKGESC